MLVSLNKHISDTAWVAIQDVLLCTRIIMQVVWLKYGCMYGMNVLNIFTYNLNVVQGN